MRRYVSSSKWRYTSFVQEDSPSGDRLFGNLDGKTSKCHKRIVRQDPSFQAGTIKRIRPLPLLPKCLPLLLEEFPGAKREDTRLYVLKQ